MKIDRISPAHYEGYVWMSNADSTGVVIITPDKEYSNPLDKNKNPFISEACLFDRQAGKSVMVKYVDGEYVANEFCIDDYSTFPEEYKEELIYESVKTIHAKAGNLKFLRIWRPESDENCAGFDVLNPAEEFFTGFCR